VTKPEDIFVPTKACTACGTGYPLDMIEHYFHRDKQAPDSYHAICKTCRAEAVKRRSLEKIGEAAKASRAMQRVISSVSVAGKRKMAATIADISDSLLTVFGGAGGFADAVKAEFDSSPQGSANRSKLLGMVANATAKATEYNSDRSGLGEMTDEELRATMVGLMQEAQARVADRSQEVDDILADQAVDDDRYLDS